MQSSGDILSGTATTSDKAAPSVDHQTGNACTKSMLWMLRWLRRRDELAAKAADSSAKQHSLPKPKLVRIAARRTVAFFRFPRRR